MTWVVPHPIIEEFAAAAVQLYSDRLRWQRTQEQGWNLLRSYSIGKATALHLLKALESSV